MFSIIMATYNCGQKVENTLQSIFSQNKELFELIVVDGASTDETLDYIKKYGYGLTLISEKDTGVYDAFNKGIDAATGKYLYFIGAGDCLRPGVLEEVKELLPTETPSFVYGDYYLMKQESYVACKFSSGSNFTANNICHQSIFYHRTIFDIVGKYDLQYKICADWVLNFNCFNHQAIIKQYIPNYIADFEEGGLSSELGNDLAFRKNFPSLIKKQFGIRLYLVCKANMISPRLASLGYRTGHALRRHLVSFAKPYVHGYRHLKKTFKNKI